MSVQAVHEDVAAKTGIIPVLCACVLCRELARVD